MSNQALLHLANLISGILPQTRAFKVRARLYRAAGARIADGARINGGVVIQYANVEVGAGTWVGRRTEFAATPTASIQIGANCDISQDVLFVCGSHQIEGPDRRAGRGESASIHVGEGTWVGARATFLSGSAVGSGCVVAAGALVRGEFPPNVVIAGIPAKIVRTLDGSETSPGARVEP